MQLPQDLKAYAVNGLVPRLLTPADVSAMLALQREVMEALPDPRWYFPSDEAEFLQVVSADEGFAYFDGEVPRRGFGSNGGTGRRTRRTVP